jgi:hypothetical protein
MTPDDPHAETAIAAPKSPRLRDCDDVMGSLASGGTREGYAPTAFEQAMGLTR